MTFNLHKTSGDPTPKEIEINLLSELLKLLLTDDLVISREKSCTYDGNGNSVPRYPHPFTIEIYDAYRE